MKLKIIFLILLLVISGEMFLMYRKTIIKSEETTSVISNYEEKVSLNDIIKELSQRNIEIMNIRKEKETYLIRVNINGDKNYINKKIESLNNFFIKDYQLISKDNEVKAILNLKYYTKSEF